MRRTKHTDPTRHRIEAELAEKGVNMSALSVALGRNRAYIQQYLKRGTPRVLPEDARERVAEILQIPPELLKPSRTALAVPQSASSASARRAEAPALRGSGWGAGFRRSEDRIPIFDCPGRLDAALATDWVERPGHYAGGGAGFAIWVTTAVGRLLPGDLIFIRPNQPAVRGDCAVVVREDEILCLGEVTNRSENAVTLRSSDQEKTYGLPEFRIMRVAAAAF